MEHSVVVAPMVRGSELTYRMLLRAQGVVKLCYTPMMRAEKIVDAYNGVLSHEDCYLFLEDSCKEDTPLIVQLCGNNPDILHQATRAVVQQYKKTHQNNIYGVDLNLGCPQKCAREGSFGAYLAKKNPELAVKCVRAMKEALLGSNVSLSCKIRILDTTNATIDFAKQLQDAGCDFLTVHCRQKEDKHDSKPDLQCGRALVAALQIPVIINGAVISSQEDVDTTLKETNATTIMIARPFLSNHRLLKESNPAPACLAAEYLEYCGYYSPPSPLYIQKHLRWIFRRELDIKDFKNWRYHLWTFLARPYLQSLRQFREVVVLYITLSGCNMPEQLRDVPTPVTFSSIRHGSNKSTEDNDEESTALMNIFG
eukprot:CAMPEP_0194202156 /NCGR_PEP_ID=MMETSP0156-20130528/2256_1 /TAXON_ID=33649 /ORGANISM="Thalassionema nitzschioides, Strain L26-B" /LENGTH=367 /DNA_ID=CAMNT_0038927571 /DNA_START=98 /DNA_END=1201 /DNA_ORIENTATION=-